MKFSQFDRDRLKTQIPYYALSYKVMHDAPIDLHSHDKKLEFYWTLFTPQQVASMQNMQALGLETFLNRDSFYMTFYVEGVSVFPDKNIGLGRTELLFGMDMPMRPVSSDRRKALYVGVNHPDYAAWAKWSKQAFYAWSITQACKCITNRLFDWCNTGGQVRRVWPDIVSLLSTKWQHRVMEAQRVSALPAELSLCTANEMAQLCKQITPFATKAKLLHEALGLDNNPGELVRTNYHGSRDAWGLRVVKFWLTEMRS